MRRWRLFAATFLCSAAAATSAHAEPISATIAAVAGAISAAGSIGAAAMTAVGAVGTVAAVGGFLINTAIPIAASLGLNALSSALRSDTKPQAGAPLSGIETQVQIGGDIARQIPFGRCKLKGHLVYQHTVGENNDTHRRIFVLGDWRLTDIQGVFINGVRRGVAETERGGAVIRYTVQDTNGLLTLIFVDGSQTTAISEIVAESTDGRWTSTSILAGMSYVVASFAYAKDDHNGLYDNGIPDLAFDVRGAKLYDFRKDSTAGGSGAHRWSDPATWEYSENPFVQAYNYLRGFYLNGQRIIGMGVPAYDILQDTFVSAANICDELVTKSDATTEPRYRCCSIVTADESVTHAQTLDVLRSAAAGYIYDFRGFYAAYAGAGQASAATITDDDLIVGRKVVFSARRSRAELTNAIYGQYLDIDGGATFEPQSYTPQTSSASVSAVGEELPRPLNLMMVPSQFQAERIAKIRMRESCTAQGTAAVHVSYRYAFLQQGDWITWASTRFGTRTWRVETKSRDEVTHEVILQLAEINAAVFDWSAAEQGQLPYGPIRLPGPVWSTTVSGFGLQSISMTSADGRTVFPGLRFLWTPVSDPTVDTVEIEYRIQGTTGAQKATDATPEDGRFDIGPVVPSTLYEARATIRTTPYRPTTWTDWVAITTGSDLLTLVTLQQFDAELTALLDPESETPGTLGGAINLAEAADAKAAEASVRALDLSRALSHDPLVRSQTDDLAKRLREDVRRLAEAVMALQVLQAEDRGTIASAGIVPFEGGYAIQGIAQTEERINNVKVEVDAVRNTVTLLSQTMTGGDLTSLSTRLDEIELTVGTVENPLVVSKTAYDTFRSDEFYPLRDTVDDPVTGIAMRALSVTIEEPETGIRALVTKAQQDINSLGEIITETFAATVNLKLASLGRSLAEILAYLDQQGGLIASALAQTQSFQGSRIEENNRAIAETGRSLTALTENSGARITTLEQVVTTPTTGLATRMSTMEAGIGSLTGYGTIKTVTGSIGSLETIVVGPGASAHATRIGAMEVALGTENIGGVTVRAAIGDLQEVVVTGTSAHATRISSIEGLLGTESLGAGNTVTGEINDLTEIVLTGTSAHATRIGTLEATLGTTSLGANVTVTGKIAELDEVVLTGTTAHATRLSSVETSLDIVEATLGTTALGSGVTVTGKIVEHDNVLLNATEGLVTRVETVETTLDGDGTPQNPGVVSRLIDAETVISAPMTGLVSRVGSLETTLGSDPAGTYSDVTARLTAVQNAAIRTNPATGQPEAVSTAVTNVEAVANGISASGQIAIQATAGGTGYSSVYRVRLSAGNVESGLAIALRTDGVSEIILDANKVKIGSLSGAGKYPFLFDSGTGSLHLQGLVVDTPVIAPLAVFDRSLVEQASDLTSGAGQISTGQHVRFVEPVTLVCPSGGIAETFWRAGLEASVSGGTLGDSVSVTAYLRIGSTDYPLASIVANVGGTTSRAETFSGSSRFDVPSGTWLAYLVYYVVVSGNPSWTVAVKNGRQDILLFKKGGA